jgi:hypothetical protein
MASLSYLPTFFTAGTITCFDGFINLLREQPLPPVQEQAML